MVQHPVLLALKDQMFSPWFSRLSCQIQYKKVPVVQVSNLLALIVGSTSASVSCLVGFDIGRGSVTSLVGHDRRYQ